MSLPEDKHREEIPSSYFDKLNEELDKKLLDEDIFIESDYPMLFSLKSDQDFSIPNDYLKYFDPSIYIAHKQGSRYSQILLAAALFIALCIFVLSIKQEVPESNEINSDQIFQYFAEEGIELDELMTEDYGGLLSLENENKFTDIEEEILFDYLIENSDQIDLAWLY